MGNPQNQEKGARGGNIVFDIYFREYEGGNYINPDGYVIGGINTYPKVYIRKPSGGDYAQNNPTTSWGIDRTSIAVGTYGSQVGYFSFTWAIPSDADLSNLWEVEWDVNLNGIAKTFKETFTIVEAGAAEFGEGYYCTPQDIRYRNRQLTAERITPEEINYWIECVSREIDLELSNKYVVPFTLPIPLVIRYICADITTFKITRMFLNQGRINELPAAIVELYNNGMDKLDRLTGRKKPIIYLMGESVSRIDKDFSSVNYGYDGGVITMETANTYRPLRLDK